MTTASILSRTCIEDIKIWMTFNMLKLNGNKTEFIMFGTTHQLDKISHIEVRTENEVIAPVEFVRNMGFFMDCLLRNTYHVKKIVYNLYSKLWDLRSIRTHIDIETVKIIIQVITPLKLDCCNSLLAGTSQQQIIKLQQIQNMACQIIYNIRKFDHISDKMKDLHWHEINERTTYNSLQ